MRRLLASLGRIILSALSLLVSCAPFARTAPSSDDFRRPADSSAWPEVCAGSSQLDRECSQSRPRTASLLPRRPSRRGRPRDDDAGGAHPLHRSRTLARPCSRFHNSCDRTVQLASSIHFVSPLLRRPVARW